MTMVELNAKIPAGPIAEKWDTYKSDMKLVNPNNKRKFKVIVVGSGAGGASVARDLARSAPHHDGITVLGPAPAPLALLRGRHRWRLLLKAPRTAAEP